MAARPNPTKSLEYGKRLAENHIERLNDTLQKLENNIGLSAEENTLYKQSARTAKKMITAFTKVAGLDIPVLAAAPAATNGAATNGAAPKRRGRPPKAKVEAVQPTVEVVKKKRGRPPKVKTAEVAVAAEPVKKKRGRPPKVKTAEVAATPEEPAKRKRGRPKGSTNKSKNGAIDTIGEVVVAAPKKRGRPKGSKNKPKDVAIAA